MKQKRPPRRRMGVDSGQHTAVSQASRIPVRSDITDAYVIGLLKPRLATYGKREFTANATDYRLIPH